MVAALHDLAYSIIAPPEKAPSVKAQPDTARLDTSPSLQRHPIQLRHIQSHQPPVGRFEVLRDVAGWCQMAPGSAKWCAVLLDSAG